MFRSMPSTLICKEFDVNPEWLRTGEGEMFAPRSIDALDALARERGLTHRDYIVIEKFLNLKPEVRAGLVDYFMEVSAALNGEAVEPDSPASTGAAIVEAEALYEKTLGFVPNTDSTASSTTDATGSTEKNKIG
jgi:hypothetical protein